MPQAYFKFAARVLEHLGAELISSDDVAIYELVKNGFDAGSPFVAVEVTYCLPVHVLNYLRQRIDKHSDSRITRTMLVDTLREAAISQSIGDVDMLTALLEKELPRKVSVDDAVRHLTQLNRIAIVDSGHGMSLQDLDKNYLTVGTLHRFSQHRDHIERGTAYPNGQAPTGEKGIGRLSAMRLGWRLQIVSVPRNSSRANVLEIDWRLFSADSIDQAGSIPVEIYDRPLDEDDPRPGTAVRISDLRSQWDFDKTEEVAQRFISKLVDPFKHNAARKVNIKWNGQSVYVPRVGRAFLDAAHNGMKASLRIRKDGTYVVDTTYWFTTRAGIVKEDNKQETTIDFSAFDDKDAVLVGPLEVELYHYNRRRLTAIPGVATRQEFKEWLDEWCGGLKLYRDGVRVMPYGQVGRGRGKRQGGVAEPYDDWLELDSSALRGKGFRFNRLQIVGCVRISRAANPELRDQANRQGLIDNEASRQFVGILKDLIQRFTADMDVRLRPESDDLGALREQSLVVQDELAVAADRLIAAAEHGDHRASTEARELINAAIERVRAVADETQAALDSRQEHRLAVFELAATGQAAEDAAHDLEAELSDAIAELPILVRASGKKSELGQSLNHMISVFKSLRAQIAAFSPAPARRRRRRTVFSVRSVVEAATAMAARRFRRHGIELRITSCPTDADFRIRAVEGHLRQILGNLLRNSIHWLKVTRDKHANSVGTPTIQVDIDARGKTISFADNGIGIKLEDAEWVFERFTSKRRGGRGLGLYIAKELCEFNAITITLDSTNKNSWKRLSKFVLDLSEVAEV